MAVKVFDRDGNASGEVDLPPAFDEPVRTDIIHKAVKVARANARQPYGAFWQAGKQHATESWNPGQGVSRVPRLTRNRTAALMPGVRGGRRAHPPKAEKDLSEKINTKERRKAIRAALAATAEPERVRDRGHRVPEDASLPIVAADEVLQIDRTRDLIDWFGALGYADELDRTSERKVRAGKGKGRGRKYRTRTSALIVVHEDGPIQQAASNIPGLETMRVEQLDAWSLAPGGDPGRLLVITESALEGLA